MRTAGTAVLLSLMTALLGASASHAAGDERASTSQLPGVIVHEDDLQVEQVQLVGEALMRERTRYQEMHVNAQSLSSNWCGTQRSSDNTAPQLGNAQNIKIVYAYAADQPDRFATYANLMQQTASAASDIVYGTSNGRLRVRWDVGTSCGLSHLDIQTVRLPNTLAYYQADLVGRLFTDLRSALGISSNPSLGTRNYLVFADRVGLAPQGAPGGQGEVLSDDRPRGLNSMNRGGRLAVLYGRGESTFFRDTWGLSYTYAAALHEISHTLGAVQNTSPSSSGGWHCNDGLDIMCYADGGSKSNYRANACATQIYDCGSDDYFNLDPAPGSYLAARWNLADSPFFCLAQYCQTVSSAPSLNLTYNVGSDGQVTVYADASADGPGPLTFQWDLDGAEGFELNTGSLPQARFVMSGTRTIRARVTDAAGSWAEKILTVQVQNSNQPPVARISGLPADGVSLGSSVSMSASASSDPDGQIGVYRWEINGQYVSNAVSLQHRVTSREMKVVTLTVTDMKGASDTVTSTITPIPNQPPQVSINAPSGALQAGRTVSLNTLTSDPDGAVVTVRWRLPDGSTRDGASISPVLGRGTQTFRVQIWDNEGATAQASVSLTGQGSLSQPNTSLPQDGPDDDPQSDFEEEEPDPKVRPLTLGKTPARISRKQLLSSGLRVSGTFTALNRVRLDLRISPTQARRLGWKISAPLTLALGAADTGASGTYKTTLKVNNRLLQRKLRKGKSITVVVRAYTREDRVLRSVVLR